MSNRRKSKRQRLAQTARNNPRRSKAAREELSKIDLYEQVLNGPEQKKES